jgi:mitochondrial import inner membrane translocase subunit TIM23
MVVNAPIRTAVLNTRFSSVTLTPFSFPSLPHGKVQRNQQKRPATTFSSSQNCALLSKASCMPGLLNPQTQSVLKLPICIRTKSTASASINAHMPASLNPGIAALDWNSFFQLRASRRRYSLVSSILTSIMTTAAGIQVLSMQDLDSIGTQVMGLDPFVVLGLATATCGAAGWLAGPFLGTALWGVSHRKFRSAVAMVSCQL